jgi:hypothetical protein
MDKRFLITFTNGHGDMEYAWYDSEEEMREDINESPGWTDIDAIEIFNWRDISI